MNIIDNIIMKNDSRTVDSLKLVFGLDDVSNVLDVANTISLGIQDWQGRNWDPDVAAGTFYEYCGNITSTTIQWPDTSNLQNDASALVEAGGWGNESDTLTPIMLNLIGYTNLTQVSQCEKTQNECFGDSNATATMYTDKSSEFPGGLDLSWSWQWCTQWGYVQTGSGVPEDQLPLIPRVLDVEYLTSVCRYAFNITTPAKIEEINQYGGFNISYPRLAIVGGEEDPWRAASPLALDVPDRLHEPSTISQPLILIEGAVHHEDENGRFPNRTTPELPPPAVANAQAQLAQYVQSWLQEWQLYCNVNPKRC